MTDQAPIKNGEQVKAPQGLDLLRAPFPQHQISKLPKPTKRQTEEVRNDFKKGIRCQLCGAWHHPQVVHLDYVGHAALTDRLLDCDPHWNWEPVATNEDGTPRTDENGGMWIRLTVCGVTRLGYGHPDGKRGGDAIKELIGDALRNAAMRFGAALDLWHKGDLHGSDVNDHASAEDDGDSAAPKRGQKSAQPRPSDHDIAAERMITSLRKHGVENVTADQRFQDDLARLRAAAPDVAARVDAEVEKLRAKAAPKPGADIDPNATGY